MDDIIALVVLCLLVGLIITIVTLIGTLVLGVAVVMGLVLLPGFVIGLAEARRKRKTDESNAKV